MNKIVKCLLAVVFFAVGIIAAVVVESVTPHYEDANVLGDLAMGLFCAYGVARALYILTFNPMKEAYKKAPYKAVEGLVTFTKFMGVVGVFSSMFYFWLYFVIGFWLSAAVSVIVMIITVLISKKVEKKLVSSGEKEDADFKAKHFPAADWMDSSVMMEDEATDSVKFWLNFGSFNGKFSEDNVNPFFESFGGEYDFSNDEGETITNPNIPVFKSAGVVEATNFTPYKVLKMTFEKAGRDIYLEFKNGECRMILNAQAYNMVQDW